MQERHDNDEIESHNHNEYPLLYKEAEISTSSLGKFLDCRKCYIRITCNMCTRDLPDMYALSPRACGPRALGIHIRQIPRAHVTTITYAAYFRPPLRNSWAESLMIYCTVQLLVMYTRCSLTCSQYSHLLCSV